MQGPDARIIQVIDRFLGSDVASKGLQKETDVIREIFVRQHALMPLSIGIHIQDLTGEYKFSSQGS